MRIWRTLRLYYLLQRAALRARAQYRFNTILFVAMGAVYQGSGFAFIWVVLDRFNSIGGWTFGQVGFLYGLRLVAHGLWGITLGNVGSVESTIRSGEFDRILLRPLNPLIQVATGELRPGAVGDLITGVTVLLFTARHAGIMWTLPKIGFCVLAILTGAAVEAATLLTIVSLTFRIFESRTLANFVDDLFSRFGSYPLHIFGRTTQWMLTFGLPVAFMAYLPATALLSVPSHMPRVLSYVAPLVGAALLVLSYRFWRSQVRQYQSSGH